MIRGAHDDDNHERHARGCIHGWTIAAAAECVRSLRPSAYRPDVEALLITFHDERISSRILVRLQKSIHSLGGDLVYMWDTCGRPRRTITEDGSKARQDKARDWFLCFVLTALVASNTRDSEPAGIPMT